MSIRGVSRRTAIDAKKAESVLFPVAAFLNGGGLTKKEAVTIFSSVYDRALKTLHGRSVEYVGHTTLYPEVVARWLRDKRFLDHSGRPRKLQSGGPNGFTALVRAVQSNANPDFVLSILIRCGNVRRIRNGKLELLQPFFRTDGPKILAFEPNAYFLADASVTLGRMLTDDTPARLPQPFWRKVEDADLSDALAKKFSIYARERTLMFLEELDDWLNAHKSNKLRRKRSRRRVGIGVFSIYSNPEIINPKI